jgi:hypothetical protein
MKGCKLATLPENQSRALGEMGDLAEESDTANQLSYLQMSALALMKRVAN